MPRILIVNGYPEKSRAYFAAQGVTPPHELYKGLVERYLEGAETAVYFVADPENPFPTDEELLAFDGAVWTGSDQTIYQVEKPEVARQIELSQKLYRLGVPQFGSCWGLQMAAVAAGGKAAKNPKGREWGFAKDLTLTEAGKGHPLTEGKPERYQGFEMHLDEVTELPETATLLTTGSHTRVQAIAVETETGSFWATQYHPEYDPLEYAKLLASRKEAMVREGFFPSEEAVLAYARDLEALHERPFDPALRKKLGADETLLDPAIRQREFRNWITYRVLPRL